MSQPTATTTVPDVYYPSSDGKPMGETGWHVRAIFQLYQNLREHLAAHRPDAYVAADMFLYYQQGDPKKNTAPDCMVIFGVGNYERRSFKTWVEGAVPAVIFEVSSEETADEDLHGKRELYARLGVREYYLFDPLGNCLESPLLGFRLDDGSYVPLTPDADGSLISQLLGLRLMPRGVRLRLIDLATNQPIPSPEERIEALAETSEALAEASETLAETQKTLAETSEALRREASRAEALEAELERLRRLLEQQGRTGGSATDGP